MVAVMRQADQLHAARQARAAARGSLASGSSGRGGGHRSRRLGDAQQPQALRHFLQHRARTSCRPASDNPSSSARRRYRRCRAPCRAAPRPSRRSIALGYSVVCLLPEKRSSSLLTIRRGPLACVTSTSATPELCVPGSAEAGEIHGLAAREFRRAHARAAHWRIPSRADGSRLAPSSSPPAIARSGSRPPRGSDFADQFVCPVSSLCNLWPRNHVKPWRQDASTTIGVRQQRLCMGGVRRHYHRRGRA